MARKGERGARRHYPLDGQDDVVGRRRPGLRARHSPQRTPPPWRSPRRPHRDGAVQEEGDEGAEEGEGEGEVIDIMHSTPRLQRPKRRLVITEEELTSDVLRPSADSEGDRGGAFVSAAGRTNGSNGEFDEITLGGLLGPEDASRDNSTPGLRDKHLFDQSLRQLAASILEASHSTPFPVVPRKRGRPPKRPLPVSPPPFVALHWGAHWTLRPWYAAPLPAEYFEGPEPGHLYMCDRCLKYMRTAATQGRHLPKCAHRMPPGEEIYRKGTLSVFEVNGRTEKEFCQRLCLLAKMFLDHKTLYYDTETFLFYLLILWTPVDCRRSEATLPAHATRESLPAPVPRTDAMRWDLIGYFSKEKQSPSEYNLSCIMTLPQYQRQGYGRFLIDFSYLLSRQEGRMGTPEKPLSDLGLLGYVHYWTWRVLDVLVDHMDGGTAGDGTCADDTRKSPRRAHRVSSSPSERPRISLGDEPLTVSARPLSITSIAEATGMTVNDVVATLEHLRALAYDHARRVHVICPLPTLLEAHRRKRQEVRERTRGSALILDPTCLRWSPYTCLR